MITKKERIVYMRVEEGEKMLHTIESINSVINDFIWGVPAMICIIGVGLYLSIRTRFLQIRKFGYAIQTTIGRMFRKKEASDGALTPFQVGPLFLSTLPLSYTYKKVPARSSKSLFPDRVTAT